MTRRSMPVRFLLLLVVMIAAASAARPADDGPPPGIVLIDLNDAIQPITSQFIRDAIDEAEVAGAGLLILKLETPGGLVTSTEEIVDRILRARIPILVFVDGTKAASAGFFITIASDVAVMAPGTRIGAAHPVGIGGGGEADAVMSEKIVNDLAAYARTIAENRGRNVERAEEAVRDSRSFTESEALAEGLIDYICADLEEVIETVDGHRWIDRDGVERVLRLRGAPITEQEMTLREEILSAVARPEVSMFLLGIGILGLYMEFSNPGLILPGVLGGVSLLLFAMSVQMLPINSVGLLFLLVGIILFVLEIKVVSYGMLTIGGLACFVFGSLVLFDNPTVNFDLRVPVEWIVSVSLSVGLLVAFLTWLVVRTHRRAVRTGREGLVGEVGTVLSRLDPDGKIFVHGEYWNARSPHPVAAGCRVRVVEVRDLEMIVEELPAESF